MSKNGKPISPAARLRAWRKSQSYSQSQAARHLGIKLSTLQSWERAADPRHPNKWLWATLEKKLK